ncbi:HAMP domain-containing sensor histidine kinase [Methylocystis sp.]|uniref:sensor histidine kinase n=1 Tax=Methylocystis sp. TaxID=1911079 RepID=UPI0025D3962D|nr:HAMP domain-containing sensor histidine kinase [Methylocystis sp.]
MGDPSLTRRIVGYLVVSQIAAFVIGWLLTVGLGLAGVDRFTSSWDELGAERATKMVIASLIRDESGLVRIEPIPELQAENLRAPQMMIAAFDFSTKAPIAGSSKELVGALEKVIEVNSTHAHFVLPSDPKTPPLGFMEPRWTRFGRMYMAVYRTKFRWDDIFHSMKSSLQWLIAYVVAAILMSTGTAWFAVRRGLTPLRAVADEAAHIDMNSLHKQLPVGGVPTEITPLVKAMNNALDRLAASAVRMRRYTANAAHELRTPIAVLRARLDNLEETPVKGDLLCDASRLQAVVEQMLIAARLTEQQATLDQEVDLAKSIRKVILGYLQLAIECDRMIEFEAGTSPVITQGNQRAIESIVANLVDNALRAEPTGGTVLVRVGDDAVVEVIDHGEGVAPSDREMIFEPFWRKSEATPGTGLGLAIAKELMDKHGGRIWVEETSSGGATFKISFQRTNSN